TNTGNVPLHDVDVVLDEAGFTGHGPDVPVIDTCTVDGVAVTNGAITLAPGQQAICVTTPYTVTDQDVSSGEPLDIPAHATAIPPEGSGEDQLNVPASLMFGMYRGANGGGTGGGGSGSGSGSGTGTRSDVPTGGRVSGWVGWDLLITLIFALGAAAVIIRLKRRHI
ncbi:MAG: DUF4381 domain-containing protein, partial [Micrococcales bacterium]|nr:DUF4381 domain-containing protein [Micrococcales bacterium]